MQKQPISTLILEEVTVSWRLKRHRERQGFTASLVVLVEGLRRRKVFSDSAENRAYGGPNLVPLPSSLQQHHSGAHLRLS